MDQTSGLLPRPPETVPREPRVARTTDEVERLRPVWDRLPVTGVDADLDYFLGVVRASPDGVHPHVIHLRSGADDVLVVGRTAAEEYPLRIGRRSLWSPTARTLVVSFDGVLGACDEAGRTAALASLRGLLDRGTVDAVLLQKIDVGGAWLRQVEAATPRLRRIVRRPVPLWSTDLPDSWDELLARRSAKSRRQIRYDDNRFRRTFGDRIEVRRLDLPEHHGRIDADLRAVASRAYQRNLGVSVVDNPLHAALLEEGRRRGWLRVWMLYVDGRPVAFWWGLVRRGTLSIGSPGYLPEFARDRVGYFTFRRMLEDACLDPEITTIDYGPGDADYKERFATTRREVTDVLLFARRPRPLAIAGALRAQEVATAVARSGAERIGAAERIREAIRRRRRSETPPGRPSSGDEGAADGRP